MSVAMTYSGASQPRDAVACCCEVGAKVMHIISVAAYGHERFCASSQSVNCITMGDGRTACRINIFLRLFSTKNYSIRVVQKICKSVTSC